MHPWLCSKLQIQGNEISFSSFVQVRFCRFKFLQRWFCTNKVLYTQVLYKQGIVKKRYCTNEFCANEVLYMRALYKQVVVQTSFCTYEGAPSQLINRFC